MRSINFVVLGEQTIANDFGKKGTVTDLTVYDRKESDIISTWVVPNGFPAVSYTHLTLPTKRIV